MNTGVSLDPERDQQDDSEPGTKNESNKGTREQRNRSPPQAHIEFRIQQLHNRRFLLLKMQRFRKKAEDNGVWTAEEMSCEDGDSLCELEAIQKELEELEKWGNHSKLGAKEGQQDTHPVYKLETPRGGIYTLPPPQLTPEDVTLERRVKTKPVTERPTGPVVPVDSLRHTPAFIRCPTCEEVIFTETHSRVGEATWISCFVCTLAGCGAGCCLIPFCTSRLKNVHHQCPQCQAHIRTYRPF